MVRPVDNQNQTSPANQSPQTPPTSAAARYFHGVMDTLRQVTTPCDTYCNEKWVEILKANPDAAGASLSFMLSCIKDCKSVQRDFDSKV